MQKTMQGGCHCGRVRFRVTADLARVTECNCSICTKKGILHLIVPPEQFELLSGQDDLATYEFNTRTAKHKFCRVCGIHQFYVPRSDPDMIDVNVRAPYFLVQQLLPMMGPGSSITLLSSVVARRNEGHAILRRRPRLKSTRSAGVWLRRRPSSFCARAACYLCPNPNQAN